MVGAKIPSLLAVMAIMGANNLAAQAGPDFTGRSAGVEGHWEARLGRAGLRLLLSITKTVDGLYFGTLTSVDQGGAKLTLDRLDVAGDSARFGVSSAGVSYVGAMSSDRSRIVGIWTQRGRAHLEFTRIERVPAPNPEPNAYALFGVPADVSVPVPPVPYLGAGKRQLVYEIHVENGGGVGLLLTRLEVLDGTSTLAHWEGLALHGIMRQQRPDVTDSRDIPAGGWATVYVTVALDTAAPLPKALHQRLTFGDRVLDGTVPVVTGNLLVLAPPLGGGDWLAANGPGNSSVHRRALVPIAGHSSIAQRYAVDWARIGPGGQRFHGDAKDNAAYFGYGAEVLAVADGVVASLKDGIPENRPGNWGLTRASQGDTLRAVPMSLETIAGNYVILDLGAQRYAFYAHMIPGSIRVKPGDHVTKGEVIGRLGNSGNSTAPHLHFHVADRNHPLAGEGLPYVIDSWDLMRAPDAWEGRANELPMLNERVRFPQR